MTKTSSDNDQVTQRTSTTAGALTRGQRRRGRGRGELVPILERLRPRQVKGLKVTVKAPAKPPSSRQKSSQQKIISVDNPPKDTVDILQADKKRMVETCVYSLNFESGKGEGRNTTVKKSAMSRKERVMDDTNEVEGEKEVECTEDASEERGGGELLIPPVPKLRRMQAMKLPGHCVVDEYQTDSQTDWSHSSSDSRDCSTVSAGSTDTSPTKKSLDEHLHLHTHTSSPVSDPVHISPSRIVTKRIQRKRSRPRRTATTPTTSSLPASSIATSASTSANKDPHDSFDPNKMDEFSASVTVVSMTHSNTLLGSVDASVSSEETISDTDDSPDDLSEYPQPSTNYQKMQRQLARQKQLKDMHAREAAEAREERFLRRQGLSKSPEKTQRRRHLTWKEEAELVEVFVYSPCSSRGSTLEPELD